MVEQRTENSWVGGSSPPLNILVITLYMPNYTIKVQSFYTKFIKLFIKDTLEFQKRNLRKKYLKIKVTHLPSKIKKYTVLRSPHVNKKSKEQFQSKTYNSLLNIHLKEKSLKKNLHIEYLEYLRNLNTGKKISFLPIQIKIKEKFII